MYHGGPEVTGKYIDVGQPVIHGTDRTKGSKANYTYFTPDVGMASSYAETHKERGKVYKVKPTGKFENDPGEDRSWRSRSRLEIVGELNAREASQHMDYLPSFGPREKR